jgi:hypothetical protein
MSRDLLKRSYVTLLEGARAGSPASNYDDLGYASCFEHNLIDGLSLAAIIGDLAAGAGSELKGKLCAAHSSAALAVNTFGPWRTDPSSLRISDVTGFRSLRFEATCPTGLSGTPPHLDVLLDGELPIGIESKCTEWMEAKRAKFSVSYDRLIGIHGLSPWFKQVQILRTDPDRYRHLDAAQLVKHALGLLSLYGSRKAQLLYIYWEPNNAQVWPECLRHRREIDDLIHQVSQSDIKLSAMSYGELWEHWDNHEPIPHLPKLRIRYDRSA